MIRGDGGPPTAAGRPAETDDLGTAERVEFAWQRTGLPLAAIDVAVLRRTLPSSPVRSTTGVALVGVGVFTTLVAVVWSRRRGRTATRRTHMRLATAAAVGFGLAATAATVLS
jgi:uncharacterized membrane protein YidH (DUF202 family)